MTIIACIDPRFGLSVEGKRQTTDTEVVRNLITEIENPETGLTVTESSARYILSCVNSITHDIPLNVVSEIKPNQHDDATVFIETAPVKLIHKLISRADRIVLYVWDKTYTHTDYFPDMQKNNAWSLSHIQYFQGASHNEVAKQVYERNFEK